jgi:hypothetical protein
MGAVDEEGIRTEAADDLGLPQVDARRLLEDLVVDNQELERLEALLGQFNLFEALGVERRELRHSDFVANGSLAMGAFHPE